MTQGRLPTLVVVAVFLVAGWGAMWAAETRGSTFAWFSDPGSSTGNTFQAVASFGACEVAGPDAFGYTCEEIPYAFEDIAATGTAVTLGDDEVSFWIDFGFDFHFYGEKRKQVKISSNGFATLYEDGVGGSGCCSGQALPDIAKPSGLVAAYWEDLDPSAGGSITYEARGTGSAERFLLQFTDVPHKGGGPAVTFQIVFFETTDRMEIHHKTATSDGGTHATGIENKHGEIGLRAQHGSYDLVEKAIRFIPP